MKCHSWMQKVLFLIAALSLPLIASADEVRVAVASNFTDAIRAIAPKFEERTGHRISLVFGSTGRHYAQIKNGAPFEIFFAADERRPKLLEEEGVAVPGSRFTYALGKLVLWSPREGYVDGVGDVLRRGDFRHIAMANPKLAPYGKAAQEVLEALGLALPGGRIVRGENISQTFQFVHSGSAELGFTAYSQIKQPGKALKGSFWDIPQNLYQPIKQQAVLLQDSQAAREFLEFVAEEEVRELIREYGYGTS